MYIINRFCYIFKNDPCKTCLVKPCCIRLCEEKYSWNIYTWRKTIKGRHDNIDILSILCGIIYIITGISAIVVKCFEYLK